MNTDTSNDSMTTFSNMKMWMRVARQLNYCKLKSFVAQL